MRAKHISLTILVCCALFAQACSLREHDPNNSTGSFEAAKETYDSGSYEMAAIELREFIARFPYSQHTADAELMVANSYFELSQYEDAVFEYEQFLKLHPNHEKLDMVMYRIGECYWQEAPEAVDREQEFTKRAMAEWRKLVARFPKSEYAVKAGSKINIGMRRLAESEVFIANYYCKQKVYHACAQRFINLSKDYSSFADIQKNALARAAYAMAMLAKQKLKEPDRIDNLFFRDFNAQQLATKARELLEQSQSKPSGKDS